MAEKDGESGCKKSKRVKWSKKKRPGICQEIGG